MKLQITNPENKGNNYLLKKLNLLKKKKKKPFHMHTQNFQVHVIH